LLRRNIALHDPGTFLRDLALANASSLDAALVLPAFFFLHSFPFTFHSKTTSLNLKTYRTNFTKEGKLKQNSSPMGEAFKFG
jgi:hypothetical protein